MQRVPTVHFATPDQRHEILAGSRFAAQFDFASYYDQFKLAPEVRPYLGARTRDGRWLQPCTLPMGFRSSCAPAQAVTWALVHDVTNGTSVECITYIDNVIFADANKHEIQLVCERFLKRVHAVGAILNDTTIDIVEAFDFLGEHYDLDKQLRSNTAKTIRKIRIAKEYLEKCSRCRSEKIDTKLSRRELAAIVGLAIFAFRVRDFNMCTVYWPLQFYRECAAKTHWDEWSAPSSEMPRSTLLLFVRWLTELLHNKPTKLYDANAREDDALLFVDASDLKWNGIAVTQTGIQTETRAWLAPMKSSVKSEPAAIWLAICRFAKQTWRQVRIITDHKPLVFAGARGYAKAYTYNELLQKIKSTYPNLHVVIEHLPGSEHPSDEPSRGQAIQPKKLEAAVQKVMNNKSQQSQTKTNGENGERKEWMCTALNPLKNRA